MSGARARLIVRRGRPGGESAWSVFELPFEKGQSVLDGLKQVRERIDPTLAFRHSCINANACKECLMLVDGNVAYACTARLEPRDIRLEPLLNKAWIRDLVTEIAPPDERVPDGTGSAPARGTAKARNA